MPRHRPLLAARLLLASRSSLWAQTGQTHAAAAATACMHTSLLRTPTQSSSSSSSAAARLAAAAGLAAAATVASTLLAAPPAHARSAAAAPTNPDPERAALQQAYEEGLADWHRHRAQSPGAADATTAPASAPTPPTIERRAGGATVVVTVPVRPGADVARLVAELGAGVARLPSSSSSSSSKGAGNGAGNAATPAAATTSVRQHAVSSGVARRWSWYVTSTTAAAGELQSPTRTTLAVQVYAPRASTGAHGSAAAGDGVVGAGAAAAEADGGSEAAGEVVITKTGGPLTPAELDLACRAVHVAAGSFAGPSSSGAGGSLGGLPARGDAFLRRLFSLGGGGGGPAPKNDDDPSAPPAIVDPAELLLAQAERLLRERGGLPWLFGGLAGGGNGEQRQQDGSDDKNDHDEAADALVAWLDAIFGGSSGPGRGGGGGFFGGSGASPFVVPPAAPPSQLPHALPAPRSSSPQPPPQQPPAHGWGSPEAQEAVRQLEALGARVYPPAAPTAALAPSPPSSSSSSSSPLALDWGAFAGYSAQKRAIEDSLLLPLVRPDVFDRLAARTRAGGSSKGAPARARPRAVLFEGPPGTGKTTSARALCQAGVPLVYVPVESLSSRWYGESEKQVAAVFRAAEALGGAVLFLDELDSLAQSRDGGGASGGGGGIHEASRRVLGVLLREIDGFDTPTGEQQQDQQRSSAPPCPRRGSVVIGATNRAADLDPALLSRFDLTLHFGLPDSATRAAILENYAAHLEGEERRQLADACAGFSGRDLRDVCEQTERGWAARIVRGEIAGGSVGGSGGEGDDEPLPGLGDYLESATHRREAIERREREKASGRGAQLFRVVA